MTYDPPLSRGNCKGLTPLVVRKILGLKEESVRGEGRELRNEETHDLNVLPNNNRSRSSHDMPMQAQGDALVWIQLIRNLAARLGWVVSTTPPPLYPGTHSLPTVQEPGWESGPVRTDTKSLGRTGVQTPDNPAHSESLYRLSCSRRLPDTRKMIKSKRMRSVGIVVLVRKPRRKENTLKT
jgi:hypothetical protein